MVTVLQAPQLKLSLFQGLKLWFPLLLSTGWSKRHLCRKPGLWREDALVCTTEGMAPSSPGLTKPAAAGWQWHQWGTEVGLASPACAQRLLRNRTIRLCQPAQPMGIQESSGGGASLGSAGEQRAAAHPCMPAQCGSHTHQNCWLPAPCCGMLCQRPGEKGIDNLPGMMEPGQPWGS